MIITTVLVYAFAGCALAIIAFFIKAIIRRADVADEQVLSIYMDLMKTKAAYAELEKDVTFVKNYSQATSSDLTQMGVDTNKRIRKLEQKDGQIQSWIVTTVECFENQQDQIDTLSVLVLGKPAGDKKDG